MVTFVSEFHPDTVDSDSEISDDQRTMDVLCAIANSISELRFTMDCPSRNQNGKVPILDMEFWVEDDKVLYTFYKKSCASPFTILKRSAIDERTKRNYIFQEGKRRLSNTSLSVRK